MVEFKVANNRLTGEASFLLGWRKTTVDDLDLSGNRLRFNLTGLEMPRNLLFLNLSHNTGSTAACQRRCSSPAWWFWTSATTSSAGRYPPAGRWGGSRRWPTGTTSACAGRRCRPARAATEPSLPHSTVLRHLCTHGAAQQQCYE